jgi:hypothetical protein
MLGDSFDIFVKASRNKIDSPCEPCYVDIFSRYKNKLFRELFVKIYEQIKLTQWNIILDLINFGNKYFTKLGRSPVYVF